MYVYLRHFFNLFLNILPPTKFFKLRRFCLRLAGISVAKGVSISGRGWIYGRGELIVGENSWLSPGVVIHTHLDAKVEIGSNCDIGPSVEFITGSHEISFKTRRAGKGMASSIKIGDGTWVGARSTIIGGVNVGAGCVIAAGSVVVCDIPENTLVAGIPARIKKTLAT